MPDENFPRLYSAYVSQFTEDLPLWRSYAAASGSPILELGCGPGRVLTYLANEGFRMMGLDNDPEMLFWAQAHLPPTLQEQANLVESDMRHFDLKQEFPLIIVPCNTFAYFNDKDARRMLNCIRKHLTSTGKVIIVVPNPEKSFVVSQAVYEEDNLQDEPLSYFVEPISNHPVQVYASEHHDFEGKVFHVTWYFDELFPDGRVQRHQHDVTYHLRSMEKTTSLFRGAGLSLLETFGDYTFGPIKPTSDEMIFIAGMESEVNNS